MTSTISIHTRRMIRSANRTPTNIGTNGFATPILMFPTCTTPIGIETRCYRTPITPSGNWNVRYECTSPPKGRECLMAAAKKGDDPTSITEVDPEWIDQSYRQRTFAALLERLAHPAQRGRTVSSTNGT